MYYKEGKFQVLGLIKGNADYQEILGYWFIPFSLFIGYVFILLEYIGKHIENPFNNSPNDTPLNALSRTIEINLKQVLGEKNLPEVIEPVDGKYLM